ncbi:MAG: MFS transporter [Verrucomicrobia bacterium]|nr:MAG: MFS transporter [Verrucomicrobiota bacterium]
MTAADRLQPVLTVGQIAEQSSALEESVAPAVESGQGGFFAKFAVLKGAQRELWLTFLIKLLIILAYSVTNWTLILWLKSDLGFNDQHAFVLVAWVWALAMTVFTLLAGSLTDAFGLRRTFLLGVFVCLVARAVMAFTTIRWLALAGGLLPLAIGEALGTPVLIAAARRYSTTRQRSISFSLIYSIMNVGFLIAAGIFDYVRQTLGEYGHLNFLGLEITTYRTLFLVSLGFELLLLPAIYFLRRGAEATDQGVSFSAEPVKYATGAFWERALLTARDTARDTVRLFRRLLGQSGFYRLLAFLLLIGFLKLIVMLMYYVFPTFGIRELGNGAPIGHLLGINYLLIIFLAPTIGALTQQFSAYRMVIVGGAICTASVFVMALPTAWFQASANGVIGQWLGHSCLGLKGSIHPYYIMTALCMVLYSVGEAFYAPRVYEYAAAIAPKGQEASYGALSYIPFLIGKLLVGTGGWLLATFCPEHGPRHSGTMWLIFALAASVAPIGLLLLRRYIRVPEAGRQDFV